MPHGNVHGGRPTTGCAGLRFRPCPPSDVRVRFFTPKVALFLHDLGISSNPEPTVVSCASDQQTITPNKLGFSMRTVRSLMSTSTGLRHLFVEVNDVGDLSEAGLPTSRVPPPAS